MSYSYAIEHDSLLQGFAVGVYYVNENSQYIFGRNPLVLSIGRSYDVELLEGVVLRDIDFSFSIDAEVSREMKSGFFLFDTITFSYQDILHYYRQNGSLPEISRYFIPIGFYEDTFDPEFIQRNHYIHFTRDCQIGVGNQNFLLEMKYSYYAHLLEEKKKKLFLLSNPSIILPTYQIIEIMKMILEFYYQ